MKAHILLALLFLMPVWGAAQVRDTLRAPKYWPWENLKTQYTFSDYEIYVGQEVSFFPSRTDVKAYKEFYDRDGRHYMDDGSGATPLDRINGRMFEIIGFEKTPDVKDYVVGFTLVDKERGDTLVWHMKIYSATAQPLLKAYYDYCVESRMGKEYKSSNPDREFYVPNTKNRIKAGKGLWTVTGVMVFDATRDVTNTLCFILKNKKGQEIIVSDYYMFFFKTLEEIKVRKELEPKTRRARLLAQYGSETTGLIMSKQVQIGMTQEECRKALGNPQQTSQTTMEGCVIDIWIYNSWKKVLYFENGKLTSVETNNF